MSSAWTLPSRSLKQPSPKHLSTPGLRSSHFKSTMYSCLVPTNCKKVLAWRRRLQKGALQIGSNLLRFSMQCCTAIQYATLSLSWPTSVLWPIEVTKAPALRRLLADWWHDAASLWEFQQNCDLKSCDRLIHDLI